MDKAKQSGLIIDEVKEILTNPKHVVSHSFIQNVEEKNGETLAWIRKE